MADFLPISREDMDKRGWDELDFICVTGDAYVDHPSFGVAIISRVLEAQGYRVGIIAQPDMGKADSITRLGRPKYAFLVTSGNIDSMVAHYTVALKKRSGDYYSPGGIAGKRPDRAVIVYCKKIREIYGDIPLIIGGLEASLRRFAHYDYWDNTVRPSILADSGADILIYGMGEHQTIEVANRLRDGEDIRAIRDIRGTCVMCGLNELIAPYVECASYQKVQSDKKHYALACRIQYDEQDAVYGKRIVQRHGEQYLMQNPPSFPLTQQELDAVYALPFQRYYHPVYEQDGGVPAIEEVEFSIVHNRGCFGACNFCSIAFHQGRQVTCRSEQSILQEAESFVRNPHFKGYIHDVGGPTANFRSPSCQKQLKSGLCRGRKCLAPKPCANLEVSHREYLDILRRLRDIDGVKKVFIRSGIRYDYLLKDEDNSFFDELVRFHISGQLKVAPEHCSAAVLDKMGKPHIKAYKDFADRFYKTTKRVGKEQYLVPYLMSSHPGSTLADAVELAQFLKREGIRPEQVQDFYPTPGTISTCMYYTGLDPYTLKQVFVPRTADEKQLQRALLQYFRPQNRELVLRALKTAKRYDLIGNQPECLIKGDNRLPAYLKYKQADGKKSRKRTNGGKNQQQKGASKWQQKAKRDTPR